MTNTDELEVAITRSKLSKKELAEALGISQMGFYNKVKGIYEFKGSEIEKLARILSLSTEQKQVIFFNNELN
jgi:hypothetical protein